MKNNRSWANLEEDCSSMTYEEFINKLQSYAQDASIASDVIIKIMEKMTLSTDQLKECGEVAHRAIDRHGGGQSPYNDPDKLTEQIHWLMVLNRINKRITTHETSPQLIKILSD